jgi:transposase
MTKTNMALEERQLLQVHRQTSPLRLIRDKCDAVMMHEKGLPAAAIGDIVSRSPRTVRRWLTGWHQCRMASIFTGHADNNNAGKLSIAQRDEVRQALQSPPSDFGLPKSFWDVPQLKTYIAASFGIVYEADQSYHCLLKFSNLSFKYPDTFDRRRDDQFVAQRQVAIRHEIQPLLHDDRWEVFAVDEVRIEQEALTRRAWLQRGERTVLKVDRQKQAQNYIGFLSQTQFGCELFELAWQNQTEILGALEQFLALHPGKLICLIWDNARFHKGKDIREALERDGLLARVHLISLPPYAPDTNPIEHVWSTAKQQVANVQRETFEDTKQAFADFIAGRTFRYAV